MAVSRVKTSSILQGFPKSRSLLAGNAAFQPTSFESIATITGTGSSGTITFSSIPSGYKHLQIRSNFFTSAYGTPAIRLQFNGDTGANYANQRLFTNSATVGANNVANGTNILLIGGSPDINSDYAISSIVDIHNYSSTTKNKTVRGISGTDGAAYFAAGNASLISGLYISLSAISSITISLASLNFTTNSTFALYGIK
jgi:hypothetical protein